MSFHGNPCVLQAPLPNLGTIEMFTIYDAVDIIPILRQIVEKLLTAVVVYLGEDRW